jgi:hypothetical protein
VNCGLWLAKSETNSFLYGKSDVPMFDMPKKLLICNNLKKIREIFKRNRDRSRCRCRYRWRE